MTSPCSSQEGVCGVRRWKSCCAEIPRHSHHFRYIPCLYFMYICKGGHRRLAVQYVFRFRRNARMDSTTSDDSGAVYMTCQTVSTVTRGLWFTSLSRTHVRITPRRPTTILPSPLQNLAKVDPPACGHILLSHPSSKY
jgi:hypothetical protein